jgi:lycopene cyclase domain-containing protein
MIFTALTLFIIGNSNLVFTRESRFWIYIFLAFFPFVLTNYFLTSIPVVIYNPERFSQIRITTIPVEDFFYSFSLVTGYIYVYELVKSKLEAKKIEEII